MTQTPRITVLTIACRPGYFDNLTAALKAQTFTDFEWVVIDDLYDIRKDAVAKYVEAAPGVLFPLKHRAPPVVTDLSATAVAVNTGLSEAKGELIYFMADYMYIHPECLARHWEIYKKFGPLVIISGRLLDRITVKGQSVYLGHPPVSITVKVGDTFVNFPEHTPPIEWPMVEEYQRPTPDNLISIWQKPFVPTWKTDNVQIVADWRLGAISNWPVDNNMTPGVHRNDGSFKWFWAGRNDSAPLKLLVEAGGMDERLDGIHGGIEADMATRMKNLGALYLADWKAPAYMLPHPFRKKELQK